MKRKTACFSHVLLHDIRYSILISWKKYLALFLVTEAIIGALMVRIQSDCQLGMVLPPLTAGDVLTYLLSGAKIFRYGAGIPFEIPYIWIFIYLMIAFIVGENHANLMTSRYMELLLSQEKHRWWASKCIVTVLDVLLAYVTIFAAVGISLFWGIKPVLKISPDIMKALIWKAFTLKPNQWTVIFVLLPILTSVCISLLQTVSILFFKPMICFTGVITLLVVSLFYCNPAVIGNGTLPLRNTILPFEGTIRTLDAALADAVLIVASIIIGNIKIKKVDLLSEV